jgi:hypothetical protein
MGPCAADLSAWYAVTASECLRRSMSYPVRRPVFPRFSGGNGPIIGPPGSREREAIGRAVGPFGGDGDRQLNRPSAAASRSLGWTSDAARRWYRTAGRRTSGTIPAC